MTEVKRKQANKLSVEIEYLKQGLASFELQTAGYLQVYSAGFCLVDSDTVVEIQKHIIQLARIRLARLEAEYAAL
jgi:hypothetical protein